MISKILEKIDTLNVRKFIWVLPLAFMLHEAEEWRIAEWYNRNFINSPPEMTNQTTWYWLGFISMLVFIWAGLSLLPKSPLKTAYIFLPVVVLLMFQNGLQHLLWLFYFMDYAPGSGILSGSFIMLPLSSLAVLVVVRQKLVSLWYLAVLGILCLPGIITVALAGNKITPVFLKIIEFGIWASAIG
jgi:hypothetical protein